MHYEKKALSADVRFNRLTGAHLQRLKPSGKNQRVLRVPITSPTMPRITGNGPGMNIRAINVKVVQLPCHFVYRWQQ